MTDEKKATAQDVIDVLRSIDDRLKSIDETLVDFGHHFGVYSDEKKTQSAAPNVPSVASDADLDGKYGNPEVKAKSPRDWTGDSMTGKRFSECPPAYLDLVASRLDYFAEQNAASEDETERKKARYNRLDASRARGWAARIRGGYVAPVQPEGFPSDAAAGDPLTADQIPF